MMAELSLNEKKQRKSLEQKSSWALCWDSLFMVEWHECSVMIGTVRVIDVSVTDLEGMAEGRMRGSTEV